MDMQQNIIKYYEKTTNDALRNLAQGKNFPLKARLNNRNLIMQSESRLIEMYKAAGGSNIGNVREELEKYKTAMKEMHKIAVKDYNTALQAVKNAKDIEEKQKILNAYADKGISGFKARNGAMWNIETYSNMYFTHLNNEMVRAGQMEYLRGKEVTKVEISTHNNPCPLCEPYQGHILTWQELEDAKSAGLFHVRCKHFFAEVRD
jgi:hypothetical protein